MSEPVLKVDRLYRFYWAGDEETLALQGVSFNVYAGALVVVAGPSGSGKSTLLRCVTGLDEPTGGTAWLCGRRMSHQTEAARSRLRATYVGILEQDRNLFDHLTVLANVGLAQRLAQRRTTRAAALLDEVGIGDRAKAYPHQLSGGEKARAGLAVALVNDPALVVADEPSGELDQGTERQVLGILRAHADRGAAVVVASHSPAVRRLADRVLTLSDGSLV